MKHRPSEHSHEAIVKGLICRLARVFLLAPYPFHLALRKGLCVRKLCGLWDSIVISHQLSLSVISCHCQSLSSITIVHHHCLLLLSVILSPSTVCCHHHCMSSAVVFAVFSLVDIICSHALPVVIVSRHALVVVTGHRLSLSVIIPAMAKGTG